MEQLTRFNLAITFIGLMGLFYVFSRRGKTNNPVGVQTVPYILPLIKSSLPFLFDCPRFIRTIVEKFPYGSTLRIGLFQTDVYLIQGPTNVNSFFRNNKLTVTRAYSIVLQKCFGMTKAAASIYLADNSGTRHNPIPGSNTIQPQDRISLVTHEILAHGLLKEGMEPTVERFLEYLAQRLDSLPVADDWVEMPDLVNFFELYMSSSLIDALFGQELLQNDPKFLQDIWYYDGELIKIVKRVPRLFLPKVYRVRDRLIESVGIWHSKGHGHPNWATKMVRDRYDSVISASSQDARSAASTDLALIWASISSVIPSSFLLSYHILSSERLTLSLRDSLSKLPHTPNIRDLESITLLQSLYAEALRYSVQIFVPRTSPVDYLQLGDAFIPPDKLVMVNTRVAHMDEKIWNSQGGKFPLDQLYPERFIVDPTDASTGPSLFKDTSVPKPEKPYFSMKGLEGSWIPYGGGQHACPGRVIAKRVQLFSATMLLEKFDFDFPNDQKVIFGDVRFGFGVAKPLAPVRFRIRKRQ